MEDQNLSDISMKGAPACGRCHMLVARYAPQVSASTGTYHRECFEAWYFGRYGKRPALQALFDLACMAFGQTASNQHEGTASLYTYFGSTVVILILVSLMPPNRPDRWLGGIQHTDST